MPIAPGQALFFVRGGYIDPADGKFWHAALSGTWWSSRAVLYASSSLANTYRLDFNDMRVDTSSGPNNRSNAFPLRCLSAVLGHVDNHTQKCVIILL